MSRLEKLREISLLILSFAIPFVIVSVPSWLRSLGVNITEASWLSELFPIAFVISVGCIYVLWRVSRLRASKDEEKGIKTSLEGIDTKLDGINIRLDALDKRRERIRTTKAKKRDKAY